MKILIVDDHLISLKLLEAIISNIDKKIIIHVAKNTNEAIELLNDNNYCAAFVDIQMPYNGINLIAYIKKTFHTCVTIVTTAHAMKGDKKKYLNTGFDYYISKPININQIKNIIMELYE